MKLESKTASYILLYLVLQATLLTGCKPPALVTEPPEPVGSIDSCDLNSRYGAPEETERVDGQGRANGGGGGFYMIDVSSLANKSLRIERPIITLNETANYLAGDSKLPRNPEPVAIVVYDCFKNLYDLPTQFLPDFFTSIKKYDYANFTNEDQIITIDATLKEFEERNEYSHGALVMHHVRGLINELGGQPIEPIISEQRLKLLEEEGVNLASSEDKIAYRLNNDDHFLEYNLRGLKLIIVGVNVSNDPEIDLENTFEKLDLYGVPQDNIVVNMSFTLSDEAIERLLSPMVFEPLAELLVEKDLSDLEVEILAPIIYEKTGLPYFENPNKPTSSEIDQFKASIKSMSPCLLNSGSFKSKYTCFDEIIYRTILYGAKSPRPSSLQAYIKEKQVHYPNPKFVAASGNFALSTHIDDKLDTPLEIIEARKIQFEPAIIKGVIPVSASKRYIGENGLLVSQLSGETSVLMDYSLPGAVKIFGGYFELANTSWTNDRVLVYTGTSFAAPTFSVFAAINLARGNDRCNLDLLGAKNKDRNLLNKTLETIIGECRKEKTP